MTPEEYRKYEAARKFPYLFLGDVVWVQTTTIKGRGTLTDYLPAQKYMVTLHDGTVLEVTRAQIIRLPE